jgi:excisionase family DNA binding protein
VASQRRDELPTYLNVPQVAKMLKVNIQTVRGYIRSGELEAARVGRRYVITTEDVDRFIKRRKESRVVGDIGLTEKGKQTVAKVRSDAERILAYCETDADRPDRRRDPWYPRS